MDLDIKTFKDYLKSIAKQLIQGTAYVEYDPRREYFFSDKQAPILPKYHFINQVINRKKGLMSKLELKVTKDAGIIEVSDIAEMVAFSARVADLYVLDYQITYEMKDNFPTLVLKFNLGVEKNVDQLSLDGVDVEVIEPEEVDQELEDLAEDFDRKEDE